MTGVRDGVPLGACAVTIAMLGATAVGGGPARAQSEGARETRPGHAGGTPEGTAPGAERGGASPAAKPDESAAESRSQAFRAVEGSRTEDVPGGPLLIAAYGVAWILLLLFVLRLGRLHTMTARELDRLERRMNPAPEDDERARD